MTNTLPLLRQELSLNPGTPAPDGSPTWTLQDPVSNRFFQLSWPAFEILSRWHLGDAQTLLDSVTRETTLDIGPADIDGVTEFLGHHHLLLSSTRQDSERLGKYLAATKPGKAKWLLKNYLFFRLPLVRPTRLLAILSPAFNYVFTRGFWWAITGLLCVGIFLVSRQWEAFTHTFSSYTGIEALLGIGIALSFAKILHEFGHALTAHKYGCRVPTMGVAFLVMFPVLYTDTNDAWKLSSRRARMHIGAAGMLAELVLAVCATLVWSFLPEGPLKAGAFLLATSTWLITLALNASPFMRFDGYFLLADYLNMPNLHDRAFALGRWWLRECLFGWSDPVPEQFPRRRHTFLIVFAIATAVYRAILFLSIAFLVYHVFFKLLGIMLMLVELAWFLGYPVQREIKIWWRRRADIHWNKQTRRSSAVLAGLIALLIVPWQSSIRAPAVIMAEQAQGLYTQHAAQVIGDTAKQGDVVNAGQVLAQLHSPELHYQLQQAKAKEEQLRWQLQQQSFAADLQIAGPALRKHWQGAQQKVRAIEQQIAQLRITAPFAGTIVERNIGLSNASWLAAGEQLFYLTAPTGIKGEAYINEQDLLRLHNRRDDVKNLTLVFIANQIGTAKIECHVNDMDSLNINQLEQPYLATSFGGSIPTQTNAQEQLIPLESRFRVRFNQCTGMQTATQELAGTASLQGERKGLLMRGLTTLVAVMHSEAGF